MLALYINSEIENDLLVALIKDGEVIGKVGFNNEIGLNEQLLSSIDKLLNDTNINKNSLNMIAVKVSGGTFSSLRTAISIANGIAYALGVPVLSIEKACPLTEVCEKCTNFIETKFISAVPIYDHEPNITKAKS